MERLTKKRDREGEQILAHRGAAPCQTHEDNADGDARFRREPLMLQSPGSRRDVRHPSSTPDDARPPNPRLSDLRAPGERSCNAKRRKPRWRRQAHASTLDVLPVPTLAVFCSLLKGYARMY